MLSKLSVQRHSDAGGEVRGNRADVGQKETLEIRLKRQGYSCIKFSLVRIYCCLSCVRPSARGAAGAKMTITTFSLTSVTSRVVKMKCHRLAFLLCIYVYMGIYVYMCMCVYTCHIVNYGRRWVLNFLYPTTSGSSETFLWKAA